jgi:hypothetical protein
VKRRRSSRPGAIGCVVAWVALGGAWVSCGGDDAGSAGTGDDASVADTASDVRREAGEASPPDAPSSADSTASDAAEAAAAEAAPGEAGGADAGGGEGGADAAHEAAVDAGPDVYGDGGRCDPLRQTGCAPQDKCIADPPACVPSGTVPMGGTCTGIPDNCVRGDLCAVTGDAIMCSQFCVGDSDCPAGGVASGPTPEPANVSRCANELTGTLSGATYPLCTVPCNPVTSTGPTGCLTQLACQYRVTAAGVEITDCNGYGLVAEGASCASTADCARGLACSAAPDAGKGACRAVCRAGHDADCAVAGDTCHATPGVQQPMFGLCCPASGC